MGNLYINNLHYIILVIALELFHIATQLRSPFSMETGFFLIFNIFYFKNYIDVITKSILKMKVKSC